MKWKIKNPQIRLYLIASIILLTGLGSSLSIYLTADDASENVLDYGPETSKMFTHDLELYGGKANVLAHEFSHWFVGLWQGKSLAFTVACITIIVTLGFYLVARNLPFDLNSDTRGQSNCD